MVAHEDLQESFYSRIDGLKESIRKTDPEVLREQAYICFSNGCLLLSSYKQSKGAKGWSARLQDENGLPMLSGSQQTAIEQAFEKAPWLLKTLESRYDGAEQVGGADEAPIPMPEKAPVGLVESPLLPTLEGFKLTGDDVSLDRAYNVMKKKSGEYDAFWSQLAAIGPYTKMLEGKDVKIDKTPFTPEFEISRRAIATFLVTLLDLIRMSYGLAGEQPTLLTFISLIEEALSGQWRQMIMTSLGFFSSSGVALGVIGKYFINTYMLMDDEQREHTTDILYKSSKSIIVGFLLWAVSVLPPQYVRDKIEGQVLVLRKKMDDFDKMVKGLETQVSASLKPLGKRAKFTELDTSKFKFTLQDLRNIQILAKWKVIVCSKDFQDLIKPLLQEPISRILLELMDVPSSDEAMVEKCKTFVSTPAKDIGETLQEALQHPDIFPDQGEWAEGAEKISEQAKKMLDTTQDTISDKAAEVRGEITADVQEQIDAAADDFKKSSLQKLPKKHLEGGARKAKPMKLKKSTRFRKATPRRATRGTKAR